MNWERWKRMLSRRVPICAECKHVKEDTAHERFGCRRFPHWVSGLAVECGAVRYDQCGKYGRGYEPKERKQEQENP